MMFSVVGLSMVLALALWWLRRRYVAVSVLGRSMEPGYRHGDRVLVRRATLASVRVGQVVVVATAPGSLMIKRAVAVPGDPVPRRAVPKLANNPEPTVPADALVVLGDNPPSSEDSRRLGYLDGAALLGVVVGTLRAVPRPAQAPAGSSRRSGHGVAVADPVE